MTRTSRRGPFRSARSSILVALATFAALLVLPMSSASFSATTDNPGNSMASDLLDPPTALTASGGGRVTLDWTATVDTYASGHRILRSTSSGGPYTQVAEISPRTTVTHIDSPADGTYYYVARAYTSAWESANSNEVVATVSTVALAGSWQTGLTHPASRGSSRVLVVLATNEEQSQPSPTVSGITYGGRPMRRIIGHGVESGAFAERLEVWVLDEAGLAAASGTAIVPTWTTAPDTPLYAHAVFANVDQTTPIGDRENGTTTGDTTIVPLAPVSTNYHDMVIGVAGAGEVGSFTALNGFTLGTSQSTSTGGTTTTGSAHKLATGADETVALEFQNGPPPNVNRQAASAFVLNVIS